MLFYKLTNKDSKVNPPANYRYQIKEFRINEFQIT